MLLPPLPPGETQRVDSLRSLNILDTPPEERFDRVTRLTRRIFDVPIVAISLVEEGRQWFKSIQGLEVRETPRDVSFCGHAILKNEVMVVEDALRDPRFADNPLVIGDPHIRFYAGHPLMGPQGQNLGTLCIIDRQPRMLTESDRHTLIDLARMAESELSLLRISGAQIKLISELEHAERKALQDPLTSMWNREGILRLLTDALAEARKTRTSVGVLIADIDLFKSINDVYGHLVGDAVLREVSARMRASLRRSDVIGRLGGEEFLVIVSKSEPRVARVLAERIREGLTARAVELGDGAEVSSLPVTVSLGVALSDPLRDATPSRVMTEADRALYRAKRRGRNRVETSLVISDESPGADVSGSRTAWQNVEARSTGG